MTAAPVRRLPSERRRQLEARLTWLEKTVRTLEHYTRTVPRLPLFALLAVPAAFLAGVLGVVCVLASVCALVLGVWYLSNNHKVECLTEMESIRRILASAGGPATPYR